MVLLACGASGCATPNSDAHRNRDIRTEVRIASITGYTVQMRVSTPKGRRAYFVQVGEDFGPANEFRLIASGSLPNRRFNKRIDRRRVVVRHKPSKSDFELRSGGWSVFVSETGPEMADGRSAKLLER